MSQEKMSLEAFAQALYLRYSYQYVCEVVAFVKEREAKVGGYVLPLEDDEQLDRVCEEIRADAEEATAIIDDLTTHTLKKIAREICADWYDTEGLPYNILPRGYCADDCALVLEPDARSRWFDGALYVRDESGLIYIRWPFGFKSVARS